VIWISNTNYKNLPVGLLTKEELEIYWILILDGLKKINYPFKGVVSDGDPKIRGAIKKVIPNIPFQMCVKHYEDYLKFVLKYKFNKLIGMERGIFFDKITFCGICRLQGKT